MQENVSSRIVLKSKKQFYEAHDLINFKKGIGGKVSGCKTHL